MFENLLGQNEILKTLKSDLEADRLPPAILFSGSPGSGKITAALELARVLSCTSTTEGRPIAARAAWNCPCPSCTRHRSLVHPDLVLFGPRTFPDEIQAALELLDRSPGAPSSYFFSRAARKLARRFDAVLYQGEESRIAKAAPLLRELEEQIDAVAPERATPGVLAPGSAEAAAKAAGICAKLEAFVPDTPPVFMIRNIEFWSRLSPLGKRKTVVMENADRMLESSRNALLKILEEPPDSVRFVLTSSRRSALMTTILSRVRTYNFAMRDSAGTGLVIERVFRSSEQVPSVESFLSARRSFPPAEARAKAEAFLGAAFSTRSEGNGGLRTSALTSLLEATKEFGQKDDRYSSSFRSFIAALSSTLGAMLREEGLDATAIHLIDQAALLVRNASNDYETLNRSPSLLAESLMYALTEAGGGSAGIQR